MVNAEKNIQFYSYEKKLLQIRNSRKVAQWVQSLPAMQEMQVCSLSQEDPLEEAWQPTPVFLSGESHGQRSLVGYSSMGSQRIRQN